MKFEIKDMYNFLLSHTFPGMILGIEIIYLLQWNKQIDITQLFQKPYSDHSLLLIIVAYAVSTVLGFIIDGVHHWAYEDAFCKGTNNEYSGEYSGDMGNIPGT